MSTLFFWVAVGVEALPVPTVTYHVVDVEAGFPAQFFGGFVGVAVAGGDVAGSAGLDDIGDFDSVYTLEGMHHVEDAVAVAGAEVVDGEAADTLDGFECADVSGGKVDDMNIVAHAGAIGGGIVVAEDAQLGPFADGHLCDVRHEVVWDAVGVFADAAAGVCAYGVEVAQ